MPVALEGPKRANHHCLMEPAAPVPAARFQISPPVRFTTGAVWIINAFGLVLAFPFLVSVLAISLLPFGVVTVLIPLLCVVASAYYLPFAFGNAYVVKLVRSLDRSAGTNPDSFIMQLALSPRIRSGFRAAMEDADDVGCLKLTGTALEFQGDSVRLSIPYDQVGPAQLVTIGLRGLWLYGRRIRIPVFGLPEVTWLEFAERASWFLPSSWRITGEFYQQLLERVAKK